ncbi:ABC transporter ATP-binding protein [Persicitalea jodogahamensis]|uniref:ABC transporter domain-containing protein n=1 Tax=Persicitalea jodogahamensis TaxID=402147 RepID=A0A8J3DC74_9BACT|nr:ABC transporter ATP-binding protein [Persicitalea jodogahamensis]GHB81232.1 hypothetical protein GCM10007390_39980 [Persicitalea jodogahamensis]
MQKLKIHSLTKTYDGQEALASVDLDIQAGEWVGIIGESGSGKSTLLKIIGRFLDADKGEIFVDEKKLPPVSSQLLKGHEAIKLVHQEYELFPNQSVRENIAYALRFYEPEYRNQRVNELLKLTRLEDVQHRKAKLLSGGEKQRTALAHSLAEVPGLLLLDEPFAHLDPNNKQTLADAIEDLKKSHRLTCLFVTHDASEALAWADRIVILREGNIIQEGRPEEVYQYPINQYAAELTGLVNILSAENNAGQRVIRPNFIRIIKDESKACWTAVIVKIRFKGTHYEYYCRTEQGEDLLCYRSRRDREVGEKVFLTSSKKHSQLVARH